MHLRRIVFFLSLFGFLTSVVLLLNFTAPNPTHRRYSSRTVLTTGQASSQILGTDGEEVLAKDLGIPRNAINNPRQDFCQTGSSATAGGTCIAYYPRLTASFRRPDFLSNSIIGEAKNRKSLPEDDRDLVNQIQDYALVAIATQRQLWIFTRVDSDVDPLFQNLAESTGGGVVRYFANAGYTDPVDNASRVGMLSSTGLLLYAGIRELRYRLDKRQKTKIYPSPIIPDSDSPMPKEKQTKNQSPQPTNHANEAHRKLDQAADLARRMRDDLS